MTDIRLLLTDLDGTLLEDDHETISSRNLRALSRLKERGVLLCACTGRVLCLLPRALPAGLFDFAITSNGASCIDLRTRAHLFDAYLPPQKAERAYRAFEPFHVMTEWYVGDDVLLDSENDARWPSKLKPSWHRTYLGMGLGLRCGTVHELFARENPRIEKIHLCESCEGLFERALAPLMETGEYEISSALYQNAEITDIRADKGTALETLCAHVGIAANQTIAFGDGGNDVKLLEKAGVGVAMGNARDALKARADAVTLRNGESGVAAYLEENGYL